jgi:hypothetical protein
VSVPQKQPTRRPFAPTRESASFLANFGVGSAKTTNQTTFRANQGIGILKRISLLNASECI